MKYVRVFCRIAEVALDLIRVLGGNCSLAVGLAELYEALRRNPEIAWAL